MANNTNTVQEADKLKNEGNECLNAWQYKEAVQKYNQALAKICIAISAKDITDDQNKDFTTKVWLSRADAYLNLGRYELAYVDTNEALLHSPNNFKGLILRAKARLNLGFEAEAVKDIEEAVKIKPGDITAGELLDEAKKRAAQVEIKRQNIFELKWIVSAAKEEGDKAGKGGAAENKDENAAMESTSKTEQNKRKRGRRRVPSQGGGEHGKNATQSANKNKSKGTNAK